MKMVLIALATASALFGADEFTSPANVAAKRPKFAPVEEKNARWLLSGDFLYWSPEMEGLKFANKSTPSDTEVYNEKTGAYITERTYQTKSLEVRGEWEPGFRMSMGYLFDEKGWDAAVHWTYFKNAASKAASQKGNEILAPAFTGNFFSNSVNTASGKWSLQQNEADLEVGKNYPVGDIFLARPFFGLKGISLKNKTVFEYAYETAHFSASNKVPAKNNFLGAGPRVGGNVAYEFGRGIGLFALGSASVLYGQFDTSFKGVSERNKALRTVSTMQIQMGLQWKKAFGKKYYLGFLAAWEQNFYSGVNRTLRYVEKGGDERDNGDLILRGLTASSHLDF
jgi:hypothetical protein